MDKYHVMMRPEALEMLDVVYANICARTIDNKRAADLITSIEESILSLSEMPNRGAEAKTGLFANQGYRKLIVKNHIIVYTVFENQKEVVVVFVKNVKMSM